MTEQPATLLAFDYGEASIGVAVGQTLTRTANPLGCVRVKQHRPQWHLIDQFISTWQPDALIVGVPVHMDGSEQPMTHAARRFMKKLEQRFSLPVHASDERLSTREAQSRLKELNRSHDSDDPIAAQIILEGWLSNQGSTP